MAGYNRIIIIGNLTRAPEYKQLPSGQGLCQLGIASNRQYRNKQTGSMVQEVCFVDVDVFGPQAESCNQYLQKGRPVLVEGRLKFDMWDSPEGQKRSKHSIVADRVVFLSSNATEEVSQKNSSDAVTTTLETEFFGGAQAPEKKIKAEQPKAAPKSKIKSAEMDGLLEPASDTGELAFNDEPPFQDDLPF